MNKNFLIFLTFALFIFSIWGSYTGNPSNPALLQEGFVFSDTNPINVQIGFTSTLSDEKLKFTTEFKDKGFSKAQICTGIVTGIVSLSIKEKFEIFFHPGKAVFDADFFYQNNRYISKSKEDFFYRVGAKWVVLELKDLSLGIDVNYHRFDASNEYFLRDKQPIDESKVSYFYKGWQIAVGISEKIDCYIPYIGVSAQGRELQIRNAEFFLENFRFKDRHKWGIFLGSSFTNGYFVLIQSEFHFINERAISIATHIRF